MKKQYLLIVPLLLFCLFIYLFYRTDKTLVNTLCIQIFNVQNYTALKEAITSNLPLHSAAIYSLPEGLWVFCITLTSKPLYIQHHNRKLPCGFFPLLFCIGLEVLQLLHITNGRFDIMDILFSFFFWFIAYYFFNHSSQKQNLLEPITTKSLVCIASYSFVYLVHVLA